MGNHFKRENAKKSMKTSAKKNAKYTKTYRKNTHNKTRRRQTGGRQYNKHTNTTGETKVYLIHSAGCIHCIHLKPVWEKLKNKFGNNAGIQLIDMEANSFNNDTEKLKQLIHPNVKIEGFPTIFKIKKNGNPEYYSGGRTADEIGKWASTV